MAGAHARLYYSEADYSPQRSSSWHQSQLLQTSTLLPNMNRNLNNESYTNNG